MNFVNQKIFDNEMTIEFKSKSLNEAFARTAVAAFILELDPTITEITDIKTAVSEAVTNCIIHGYEGKDGVITINCGYIDKTIYIEISDNGIGIDDINRAREPLYTSKPEEERSGLGFTVMESFMDKITVTSQILKGTTIKMTKTLKSKNQAA